MKSRTTTSNRPWLDRLYGEPIDPLTKALIAATVETGISKEKVAEMFNATFDEVSQIMGHVPEQASSRIH